MAVAPGKPYKLTQELTQELTQKQEQQLQLAAEIRSTAKEDEAMGKGSGCL